MKIFLGGTCGKSNWREELIPYEELLSNFLLCQ